MIKSGDSRKLVDTGIPLRSDRHVNWAAFDQQMKDSRCYAEKNYWCLPENLEKVKAGEMKYAQVVVRKLPLNKLN